MKKIMKKTRNEQRKKRARRIRKSVSGTAQIPRVNVFRSLTNFYVQIIDDEIGNTLVSASLHDVKDGKNTVEGAQKVAEILAKKASKKNISEVVFDRAGYKYHGKVKAFAEKLRECGLIF